MTPKTIIPLLRDALNLTSAARVVKHPAGMVNAVFRLIDGERSFAVKWFGEDAFSGIERSHQFVLQQQLAERGIAPKPVWLSGDELIWVENWEQEADPHPNIRSAEELASVLARIHKLPITSRPLNLYPRWLHYIQTAGTGVDDTLYQKALSLRSSVFNSEQSTADYVLCHNDLVKHHILRQSTPFIVDWEYAAMGNRYFDVAGCAKINAMSDSEVLQLARAYAFEISKDENEVIAQVHKHMQIVDVTNELWRAALHATKASTE